MTRPKIARRIRANCVEDGSGCLVWQGCMSHGKHPQIKLGGVARSARRVLWEAEHGPLPVRIEVAHRCKTRGCLRHIGPQSRSDIHRRLGAAGVYSTVARCGKIAKAKRAAVGKLTEEQAALIRQSDETTTALARRLGIAQSTVHAIKAGTAWKDYANPFAGMGVRA